MISCFGFAGILNVLCLNAQDTQRVVIKWLNEKPQGHIDLYNGGLERIALYQGQGKIHDNQFIFSSSGSTMLEVSLKNIKNNLAAEQQWYLFIMGTIPFPFFSVM